MNTCRPLTRQLTGREQESREFCRVIPLSRLRKQVPTEEDVSRPGGGALLEVVGSELHLVGRESGFGFNNNHVILLKTV